MNPNEQKIYLRVLGDLPFMLEIIHRNSEQADSFTSEMLFKRILLEREAVKLEEDRAIESERERIKGHENETMRRSDD